MPHPIRIGIGGWTYAPWRGTFFPPKLPHAQELHFASRAVTAIEVNGTYYGTQSPATFAKWARETPEGFVFTLKALRYITVRKELAGTGEAIRAFLDSGLAELGPKLGAINWQLMPTKAFDPDDIARFLDLLPGSLNGLPLRHAIEARHESFNDPAFLTLLRNRGIAAVHGADSTYPEIDSPTAPFAYLRLMGTREGVDTGYPESELRHWAARIKALAAGQTVFAFIIAGHKVANPAAAQALMRLVDKA